MRLHSVDVKDLAPEVYQAFATKNTLLTAGNKTGCNTMTIGWCQVGRIWNKPVCTVFVRPERYTYQFVEENDYYTVSLLPAEAREVMKLCGTKSGRDLDKIKECGLTLCYGTGEASFFEEAEMVLVCKKMYVQDMDETCVLDQDTVLPFYGKYGNWHRIYVGEIVEAYVK